MDGRSTTELKLRDISRGPSGTVLQDPAKQIVGATVEAELAFGPENLGVPREEIRERIREVAEQAGIQSCSGARRTRSPAASASYWPWPGILMLRPRLLRRRRAAREPRSGDR